MQTPAVYSCQVNLLPEYNLHNLTHLSLHANILFMTCSARTTLLYALQEQGEAYLPHIGTGIVVKTNNQSVIQSII